MRLRAPLLLLGFSASLFADTPAKPKFTIGKETTYVTEPVDRDGYIDYSAALNRQLGKGITAKTNAAVLLFKAFGPKPEGGKGMPPEFFQLLGIEAPPEKGDYFVGLYPYIRDHLNLPPGPQTEAIINEQVEAMRWPWHSKLYPEMANWLRVNEKPLAVVLEATKRPEYYHPLVSFNNGPGTRSLISALLPGVQKCRELANALVVRAMLRTAEGKTDEAWQDLLACHRLGRLVSRGGTLIEGLVGVAIEMIASNASVVLLDRGKLTAKQVQGCLSDLQQLPARRGPADKVGLAERFTGLESVLMIERHGLDYLEGMAGGLGKPPGARPRPVPSGIDWDPALKNMNRWYDRLEATLRVKDRAEREKLHTALEQELKDLKSGVTHPAKLAALILAGKPDKTLGKLISDVLITLLVPAIHKVQQADDRSEQVAQNLQLAFALALHQREKGSYPKSLDELTPKYLKRIPIDQFTGKPLIYLPRENGYLLYSVGVNGMDEGGRGSNDDPRGDDLSVRIPVPEPKRQP